MPIARIVAVVYAQLPFDAVPTAVDLVTAILLLAAAMSTL